MTPVRKPHAPPVRTALHHLIARLDEGVILVDHERRIVWANESALAMHGVKRLNELGEDIEAYRRRFMLRYRNHHRVLKAGYPMQRAVAGSDNGDVTVFELYRRGDDELVGIHQVKTVTMRESSNEHPCHAMLYDDVTARFQAEERFERTFAANPAPSMICRLSDACIVKVNIGMLQMTEYSSDELLGRTLREIDFFPDQDMTRTALNLIGEGHSIPQTEAVIRTAHGKHKYIIVAGRLMDVGDEQCMLLTFIDLDSRRNAEAALRHSEELFSKSFRLAPVPMVIVSREDKHIRDANHAFFHSFGHTAESALGASIDALNLWSEPQVLRAFEQQLEQTGAVHGMDAVIASQDGSELDCVVSAESVAINGQACVLLVLQDITERKRTETELISAIEAVMQDTSWFSRQIIEKLARIRHPGGPRETDAALADLTTREQQVLGAVCRGSSDAEIAQELGISRNTVRNHVSTIYGKIGVGRRAAAIVWARERGFTGARARAK